jgi:hypothetical protein
MNHNFSHAVLEQLSTTSHQLIRKFWLLLVVFIKRCPSLWWIDMDGVEMDCSAYLTIMDGRTACNITAC